MRLKFWTRNPEKDFYFSDFDKDYSDKTLDYIYYPIQDILRCLSLTNIRIDLNGDLNMEKKLKFLKSNSYSIGMIIFMIIKWFHELIEMIERNSDASVNTVPSDSLFDGIVVLIPCLQATICSYVFFFLNENNQWLKVLNAIWEEIDYRVGKQTNWGIFRKTKSKIISLAIVCVVCNFFVVIYTQYRYLTTYDVKSIFKFLVNINWMVVCHMISTLTNVYFCITCIALKTRFKEVLSDLQTLEDAIDKGANFENYRDSLSYLQWKFVRLAEVVDSANRFWKNYIFWTMVSFMPFSIFCYYQMLFVKHELAVTLDLFWYGSQSLLSIILIFIHGSSVPLYVREFLFLH